MTNRREPLRDALRLRADQLVILLGQVAAFMAFVWFGDRADQRLSGALDERSVLSGATIEAAQDYRDWDDYSGYALLALAILFVAGVFRSVHRRSTAQLVLFAVLAPLMFVSLVLFRRFL